VETQEVDGEEHGERRRADEEQGEEERVAIAAERLSEAAARALLEEYEALVRRVTDRG